MKKLFNLTLFVILGLLISLPAFATTDSFSHPQDSYLLETDPTINYGSESNLIADGVAQHPEYGNYGEVATVIQWDVSSIPKSFTVNSARITFDFFNSSSGPYNILQQLDAWSENTVLWNDLSTPTIPLATIPAGSTGLVTLDLNSEGIALIQGWIDGSVDNNGIAIRSTGTNDGIQFHSRESGTNPPTLEVNYEGALSIEELTAKIRKLEKLFAGVTRSESGIHFTKMNVHIENGLGTTNGNTKYPASIAPSNGIVNGLGNLIVGYNEDIDPEFHLNPRPTSDKSGSHNIVVGYGNNYSSFGGLVIGQYNIISGPYSSVTGGRSNIASGRFSSISAGSTNTAISQYSSITGGYRNSTRGFQDSISGGSYNVSKSSHTSISGGTSNLTQGATSSVNGGQHNTASGHLSSVLGGSHNTSSGYLSSVTGGYNNTASGPRSIVNGGENNTSSGANSSISGGINNIASGNYSQVSGGNNRTASGEFDWVAGSLIEDN